MYNSKLQNVVRYITVDNREAVFKLLSSNAIEWLKGGDLEVTVRYKKSKRSNEQNKLLWAIYRDISEQAFVNGRQYTTDVWHEYFKGLFIGYSETVLPNGRVLQTPISTTTLNTEEMTVYINNVMAYGTSEFGIEFV